MNVMAANNLTIPDFTFSTADRELYIRQACNTREPDYDGNDVVTASDIFRKWKAFLDLKLPPRPFAAFYKLDEDDGDFQLVDVLHYEVDDDLTNISVRVRKSIMLL